MHPNAVAVVAHIPWLLWMIDVLLTTSDVRRRGWAAAAIALLAGSQLLLGYPQYVWFSLLVEAGYVLSRLPAMLGSRWRVLMLLVAAELLGLLVGAVQLLPTIEALGDSTRAAVGEDFALSGSLPWPNAVQLIAPYLLSTRVVGENTHELGLYIGAVPLLLGVWLVTNRQTWGAYRPLIRAVPRGPDRQSIGPGRLRIFISAAAVSAAGRQFSLSLPGDRAGAPGHGRVGGGGVVAGESNLAARVERLDGHEARLAAGHREPGNGHRRCRSSFPFTSVPSR